MINKTFYFFQLNEIYTKLNEKSGVRTNYKKPMAS